MRTPTPSLPPSLAPLHILPPLLIHRNIFENDDCSAIVVYTDDQYQGVQDIFPLKDKPLAEAPFPKRFPFSAMVHQVYDQLKQFVVKCTGYADKLNLR